MMMLLGTLTNQLVTSTPEERTWLSDFLSIENKTWSRGGYVTELTRLFDPVTETFPAGYGASVRRRAKLDGVDVQIVDKRKPPATPIDVNALTYLRDYQREALTAFAAAKRGIIEAATGAGKSTMIAFLPLFIPCHWLMLVHRAQLADDVANRYASLTGLPVGRYYEGRYEVEDTARLVCASFPAIITDLRREKTHGRGDDRWQRAVTTLDWAQGVVVDEVHTAPARTHLEVINRTRNAYWRLGLSGTALDRSDKKIDGVGAIGPIIHRIPAKVLVDRGVLARPTIRMVTARQATTKFDWAKVYDELVVQSARRNAVVLHMAKRATKPAILFVNHVEHGRILSKMLAAEGISNEFVWGAHSTAWRNSLLKRLAQGHFDVIVSSPVLTEGVDVPVLRSVITAAGGKAIVGTMQRLGRGMRVDRDAEGNVRSGGDVFECWDVFDQITSGMGAIQRHAMLRRAAYAGASHEVFVEPEPPGLPPGPSLTIKAKVIPRRTAP